MGELKYNLAHVSFHPIVLDGPGYEAGKQLAEVIKQDPSGVTKYQAIVPIKQGLQ